MTFHAIIQYLRYRWRAQGRHGTHSPFVYGFVKEVLRKKDGTIEERILRYAGTEGFLPKEAISDAKSNSVILFRSPHASSESSARWDALCSRSEVSLSLDLYSIGLLFFRQEILVKQHFVLK